MRSEPRANAPAGGVWMVYLMLACSLVLVGLAVVSPGPVTIAGALVVLVITCWIALTSGRTKRPW
jgi:hypothetical protein